MGGNNDREAGLDELRDSLDYERFKIEVWRQFHAETGRWPLLSILFHYIMLIALLGGMGVLIYLSHSRNWDSLNTIVVGATSFVVLAVTWIVGEKAIYKFEWSRHRRS